MKKIFKNKAILTILLIITIINFFYNGYFKHLKQNVFYDFRALYNASIESQELKPNLYGKLIYRKTSFGYLPIITYLFKPLTIFKESIATIIWLHINILFIIFAIYLMTKINRLLFHNNYFLLTSILTLNFHPLFETIKWGQLNIILFVLILLIIYSYLNNNYFLTGLFLGMAIILKIIPGLIILYFIIRQKFVVIFYTTITVILLLILSISLFEFDLHKEYFTEKLPTASKYGYKGNIYDQSFQAMSFRLFWKDNGFTKAWIDNFNFAKKISFILRISSVVLLILVLYKNNNSQSNIINTFEILIANTTIHLFHSLSWEHHFMLSIYIYIFLLLLIKNCEIVNKFIYYLIIFISYFILALRYGYDNILFTEGILILFTGIKLYGIIIIWILSIIILFKLKRKYESIIN